MRLRRKQATIANLRYFALAALGFVAAGFIAHPAAAALLLIADACVMIGVAGLAGFNFDNTLFHSPARRSLAYLALLFLYAAVVELLVGYPLRWLLRDHSLEATLALSTTTVIALLSLWKLWPAFGLTVFWRNAYRSDRNSRSLLDAASRSIEFARRMTADNEIFFSHGFIVCLCLLATVIGATTIGGWGNIFTGSARFIALVVYAVAVVPLASLTVINRTADAMRIDILRKIRARREVVEHAAPHAAEESVEHVPENIGIEELDAMLLRCVRASQTQLALAALERGANPNCVPAVGDRDQRSVIELACVNPDMRLLRGLISKGADLNRAHAGMPPLIAATRDSFEGRPDAVMTLLTNGADARCADTKGDTPLHCAALSEKPIAAALLCDSGALLDAINSEGLTPLGVACAAANWELVKFLLERGAKPDTDHGQPAIVSAASVDDDDPQGIKLLLKRKARVDAQGPLKRTALMTAAMNGNAFVAELLLDAGAQIDLADAHGVTALMEAARAGSADVLDVFASRKPSLDLVDSAGRSALIIASQSIKASEDIVRRLLDMGASREVAVADGRRAVDFAAAAGRWSIVALLDPSYPIPQSLAHEPIATSQNDSVGHLLDALRFGHWSVVDRFERDVRELPESSLANLFVELITHDDPAPRRWLLTHGLSSDSVVDGKSLLAHALDDLPSTLAAVRDLLDAAVPCGGSGALNHICRALASGDHREALETLGMRLIDNGADTFAADHAGTTPLANAVAAGEVSLTRAMLSRGTDPNARDHHGRTPLFSALTLPTQAAVELTKLLIVAGAIPDVAAANGETPLGLVLARPEPQLQQWLNWHIWKLPHRPLRDSDLLFAAAAGDAAAVTKLITLGFDVNAADAQGATPLLRAAGNGHVDAVAFLLKSGADAAHAATSGATALSAAVIARKPDVVAALAAHGVDIDQRLKGGGTALMIAAALGYPEIVTALLKAGAYVDASDDSHTRALHAAAHFAFHGRDGDRAKAMLDTLLENGASIDARNSEGQTALLLLLGAHAEAGATSDEKLLLALMPAMLKRNADINAADNRGVTPLHACAMHGLMLPARALIAAGADTQLRDMRDRTAREVAHLLGFIDVAVELAAQRTAVTAPPARKTAHDFD
jgi:ankyrin repeat protein